MYANTAAAQNLVDTMNYYGVQATGEVVTHEYHEQVNYDEQLTLHEVQVRGGKITRLRILKERGLCDISYCHATLKDGTIVPVRLDGDTMCVPFRKLKGALIEWAKEQGVFAKGLGLLDEGNWAVLG